MRKPFSPVRVERPSAHQHESSCRYRHSVTGADLKTSTHDQYIRRHVLVNPWQSSAPGGWERRMHRPNWVPAEVDLSRPSAARVYDYYLGGSHNLEVDRRLAREAISLWPELPEIMQNNRAFLRRAVRYLAAEGITQFLDIGSGIPTVGNVHQAAQQARPGARVVYVDNDPVAVAHSRAILAGEEHTAVVHADLRAPETLLEDQTLRATLDLAPPLAVLMVAV